MDCDLSSSKKEIIQLQNGLASKIETNMARLEMMLNSKVKSGNVKISHKKLLEEIGADLAGFKIDG